MHNFKDTLIYSLIQGFFWMAWAALLGFSSTYLLGIGLTNGEIGVIIAVCGLLSAILQPILSAQADHWGGRSLKRIMLILLGISVLLALIMIPLYGKSTAGCMILFGLSTALLQTLAPLVNALGAGNHNTNLGLARGVGSAAYAVLSAILGIAAVKCLNAVPAAFALSFIGMGAAVVLYRYTPPERPAAHDKETTSVPFCKKYPRFMVITLGVWLLYASHILLTNFGYQIILTKGGDSASWGTVGSIAAIMELPTMFLFAWFLKLRPSSFWVRFSGIAFFLQAYGALIIPNVSGYYVNQIFQLGGWAVIQVASVYYIREAVGEEDAVKGQSCFTTAYTAATVAASAAGGMLIDRLGISAMIIAAIVTAGLGASILIIAVSAGKPRGNESEKA